jgi:nitrogen fixation protein FixH
VLWAFVLFFATVIAVNGVMIYSAVSTHTGLVADEPYRKGLHYNERIAADERQGRLGWIGTLEVSRDGRISLTVTQTDGQAVRGLKIEGVVGRPSTNRHDMRIALAEDSPGHYQARAAPLAEGNWIVTLDAFVDRENDEPTYRMRRRIWLKP